MLSTKLVDDRALCWRRLRPSLLAVISEERSVPEFPVSLSKRALGFRIQRCCWGMLSPFQNAVWTSRFTWRTSLVHAGQNSVAWICSVFAVQLAPAAVCKISTDTVRATIDSVKALPDAINAKLTLHGLMPGAPVARMRVLPSLATAEAQCAPPSERVWKRSSPWLVMEKLIWIDLHRGLEVITISTRYNLRLVPEYRQLNIDEQASWL